MAQGCRDDSYITLIMVLKVAGCSVFLLTCIHSICKAAYGDDTSNQNNVKGAHYAVYKAACGFLNVKRSYMTPRSALYVPEEGSRALNSPKNKLWEPLL